MAGPFLEPSSRHTQRNSIAIYTICYYHNLCHHLHPRTIPLYLRELEVAHSSTSSYTHLPSILHAPRQTCSLTGRTGRTFHPGRLTTAYGVLYDVTHATFVAGGKAKSYIRNHMYINLLRNQCKVVGRNGKTVT